MIKNYTKVQKWAPILFWLNLKDIIFGAVAWIIPFFISFLVTTFLLKIVFRIITLFLVVIWLALSSFTIDWNNVIYFIIKKIKFKPKVIKKWTIKVKSKDINELIEWLKN